MKYIIVQFNPMTTPGLGKTVLLDNLQKQIALVSMNPKLLEETKLELENLLGYTNALINRRLYGTRNNETNY